jgi:hypothetical protein
MKTVKYLLAVLTGLFLFVACEKEFSLESGFAGKVAVGSLLDTNNNCKDIVVRGEYYTDSTVADSNYVIVQVNVDSGGSYNIFSDTQNGFSFQDSGVVAPGLHSIKLKARGRPLSARQSIFQVAFGTSFCSFNVTVVNNNPATYTLVSGSGSCSGAIPGGNFTTGTALTAANTVTLGVNVTAVGNYSVKTGTVNGISFNGSGSFTTLGLQTITLRGSGTPTVAGANVFPVSAGGSTCSFSIPVTAGGTVITDPNLSDSAWSFVQGTRSFQGPFLDVFDTTINNAYVLVFVGYTPSTADTLLYFGSFIPGTSIQTGTYSSKDAAFFEFDYRDTTNPATIYTADPTTVDAETKLTIASYDPTTKIVTGTFTGTAMNAANAPVPITNGRFRAKVR